MNPFDLRGPAFLLFYLCLGVVVAIVVRSLRRSREVGSPARIDTSDPYLIAYLRGGKNEAARVATISLIDRGLLKEHGEDELAAAGDAATVRRPIEKALIELFKRPQAVSAMFGAPAVEAACREFEDHLVRRGALPNDAVRAQRRELFIGAVLVILGVAAGKIFVALGRGHTNVLFLVILAIVFIVVCRKVANRPRTRRGDELLQDLQRLFGRLRDRAVGLKPGGRDADATMLAAVFGVGALPATGFAYAHRLFPKSSKGGSNGGSSCGSSCGSSSGSSSCGGGGGGCGGCGGGGD
jgi:uncharacterized protein (TIGR04222 family)